MGHRRRARAAHLSSSTGDDLRFGEAGGELDYAGYLGLDRLLDTQDRLTDEHDELLFIVIHQVYELWFKLILWELEATRDRLLDAGEPGLVAARHHLGRVAAIERVMLEQVDVLTTMTPEAFARFRRVLAPASGFQSVQYWEIELLSGGPDAGVDQQQTPGARERLVGRRAEPTVWDGFQRARAAAGDPSLVDLLRHPDRYPALAAVAEALVDHDEGLQRWRHRHVIMVRRQIGDRTGTGGSSGARYLAGRADTQLFPALWSARNEL